MRILFVQTNSNPYLNPFPLGAALVASRLRRDGHDVSFVDLMGERDPLARAREAVRRGPPDLACFSIRNRDNMSTAAYADPIPGIAALVRAVAAEAACPTLLGGTAFTTFPARLLDVTGATWGIAGDDLDAVSRFVASVAAGRPDLATPGLVRRDEAGGIVEVPFRIAGYAHVPIDLSDLVDLDRYRRGFWQAGVITRSGCPEACTYCDTFHTFGRSFVLRDPDLVAGEMLALKRTGKIRSVFLVDAGFNRPLDHAKAVLHAILRRGAQLQLYAIHDPGAADAEYFSLFRRAGGIMVSVFAESLSDRVLGALRKPFGAEAVERDVAWARRAGVGVIFMPTFGAPGETRDTVDETLRRAARLAPTVSEPSVGLRIQPRTALRERAVAEGLLDPADDCWEPHFYVSPDTPAPWLARRLASWRRRHPLRALSLVPFAARMAFDRPWRRGPDPVA